MNFLLNQDQLYLFTLFGNSNIILYSIFPIFTYLHVPPRSPAFMCLKLQSIPNILTILEGLNIRNFQYFLKIGLKDRQIENDNLTKSRGVGATACRLGRIVGGGSITTHAWQIFNLKQSIRNIEYLKYQILLVVNNTHQPPALVENLTHVNTARFLHFNGYETQTSDLIYSVIDNRGWCAGNELAC